MPKRRSQSSLVTFLFTDIEGSTALWEAAPEAMRSALERHDAILHAAIDGHEGSVFSTGGDGVAAVFARAADALAAAVDAQAALREIAHATPTPLRVRMGVHTGEATERDGDYFGAPVNRAARLMAAGHGGQVLVSATTAGLIGPTDLTDLGEHQLRDLAEPQRVFQVGTEHFPPLRSLDVAATNLPVQPTSLIGRQPLIAELAALVEECALVTLTGVGGVGKTRLAVEVGAEVLPRFPDGVWLVDLAPIAHDEMVVPTVAEVLSVATQTGEPLITTLVSRVRTKRLLVILDNCEHLLSPVARLADRVATSAPGVRVLATSREPLGVAAERVRAVPSLAESTEAVELFIERARQAGASLDAAGQVDAAREICRRLDGLPLAIELAAARARMMAPAQIAERLDQRFRLLTGGGRTAVERHRTLQATVSWSYDLLEPVDQVVFQRLSIMSGGFDLDAAEAIAGGGAVEAWEVLDALGRLVDKSMVATVVASDGTVRYRLLETLRQFAADRLAEQPDIEQARDRHAEYWMGRAVTIGRGTRAEDQAEALAAADRDIDNYRSALAHLLTAGRGDDAARLLLALGAYWNIRRTWEGLRWYQQALEHPELSTRRRMHLLALAAHAAAPLGELDIAETYASESVELAAALGTDPPWDAYQAMCQIAMTRGDWDELRRWWAEGREAARRSGLRYFELLHESNLPVWPGVSDLDAALRHYQDLLPVVRSYGAPLLISLTEGGLARVLFALGEREQAREIARRAIISGELAGPVAYVAILLWSAIWNLEDATDDAVEALARAARIGRDEGNTFFVISCSFITGAVAARRGDIEIAAALLAGAGRVADPRGIRGDTEVSRCRAEAEATVAAYTGDLSAARARGASMTIDDLVNEVLRVAEA
jgi:predicted ATPase/class 3 adenylate cyclase